ncbi:MAG: hypothetical protein HC838_12560 [Spirulinaceae cyanobacterium RM2_2_10]|nr:hypothetical protein [Spirulinaceae cyanobacterium SM2_1_0]NJO20695.1 hypothetical protein [Spirulinaceae cyanobacterium RM2_2_10]
MTDFSHLKPGDQMLVAPLTTETTEVPRWLAVTKRARRYAYLKGDLRIDLDSGHLFQGSKWLPYHGVFSNDADYQAALRTRALATKIASRCQSATQLAQLGLSRLEPIGQLLEIEV